MAPVATRYLVGNGVVTISAPYVAHSPHRSGPAGTSAGQEAALRKGLHLGVGGDHTQPPLLDTTDPLWRVTLAVRAAAVLWLRINAAQRECDLLLHLPAFAIAFDIRVIGEQGHQERRDT